MSTSSNQMCDGRDDCIHDGTFNCCAQTKSKHEDAAKAAQKQETKLQNQIEDQVDTGSNRSPQTKKLALSTCCQPVHTPSTLQAKEIERLKQQLAKGASAQHAGRATKTAKKTKGG